MNNFGENMEAAEKPKNLENQEAPVDVEKTTESAEEIGEKILENTEKEFSVFQTEQIAGEAELAKDEVRAEKDGLEINIEDKQELQSLNGEAIAAKEELVAVLSPPPLPAEYLQQYQQKGPPPLPQEYVQKYSGNMPPPLPQEKQKAESLMKERVIESPELLDEKKASKKLLAEERIKLAQEIREQRNAQGSRLSRLKNVLEAGQEKIEGEQGDMQLGRLSQLQSSEADLMAGRIFSEELNEQDATIEKENIDQLIENSKKLKSIKDKIKDHYEKAGEVSRERFKTMNRSVENVMKRNDAFLVHIITELEGVRHNENSNVSSEATLGDDVDILLSLEPSISTSSIKSGNRGSLWAGGGRGFLIGGGRIGEAGHTDLGTHPRGINDRGSAGGRDASLSEIDEVVGREDGTHTGMNEIVIHNPEIFGFFQQAGKDENGRFWIGSVEQTRYLSEELPNFAGSGIESYGNKGRLKRMGESYRDNFSIATERGIPLYIMTEEREVYECLNVNDDGTIEVGKQLTPEDVATGRAGISTEKRKALGEKILEKKIFKKQETIEEAKEIISNL